MTWEELLTHMDNLVDWGRDSLKGWKKQASALQVGRNETGNATDMTVASDRQYEGFKDEWHKEWRRGDFPSWKETQTTAWMDNSYNRYQPKDYVDSLKVVPADHPLRLVQWGLLRSRVDRLVDVPVVVSEGRLQ